MGGSPLTPVGAISPVPRATPIPALLLLDDDQVTPFRPYSLATVGYHQLLKGKDWVPAEMAPGCPASVGGQLQEFLPYEGTFSPS